MKSTQ